MGAMGLYDLDKRRLGRWKWMLIVFNCIYIPLSLWGAYVVAPQKPNPAFTWTIVISWAIAMPVLSWRAWCLYMAEVQRRNSSSESE